MRGRTVLDAGCGTGYFTRVLQRAGANVWGADNDLQRVLKACEVARQLSLPSSYLCADISCLPFRDSSFDLVIMVTVLEFLSDRDAVLAEVCRVLRVGGKLVVVSLLPGGLWYLGRRLRPRAPYDRVTFPTEDSLREMLGAMGTVRTVKFLYAPPWPFLSEDVFFSMDALIGKLCPGLASMVGAAVQKD